MLRAVPKKGEDLRKTSTVTEKEITVDSESVVYHGLIIMIMLATERGSTSSKYSPRYSSMLQAQAFVPWDRKLLLGIFYSAQPRFGHTHL